MTRPKLIPGPHTSARGSFGRASALTSASTLVAMVAYAGPLGNAPNLAASLSATSAGVTWILSSMSIGLAVSLLGMGALADDIGRRRVFSVGALAFTAGSVACAVAPSAAWLVVGRVIQGVGAAGLIATGLGLVAVVATGAAQRSAAASWWGAAMGAGIALGPLLTGLLDLGGHWRGFYWLLALAGVGMFRAAAHCFVETPTVAGSRVDRFGLATLTGGLTLLVASLVEVRAGSRTTAVAGTLVAALLLTGFVITQVRGRRPMLDLSLFRRPDFAAATLGALATGAGVVALMSYTGTFLVRGMGLTTFEAAALLTLWSATSAISAVLTRQMPARFAGNPQLVAGLLGVGVGMLGMSALSTTSTPARLVPGLLLAGVASGVLNAGLGRQATASAPALRAALGTGTNNTARYLGAALGIAVVSLVAAADDGDRAGWVAGWNLAAGLAAAVSLVGAAAVWGFARRRPPTA